MLKTIKYIKNYNFEKYYIIVAEDTLINIINYQFAKNYSNINLPGYMYNIRKKSITHIKGSLEHLIKESISFFYYYKLLYKYIKDFDKDRNFFYYELKLNGFYLLYIKKYNIKDYLINIKDMLYEILKDEKASIILKNLVKQFI